MTTRILVLGGGFAGLTAVDELAAWKKSGVDLDIHLIDRSPCNIFAPLLPDLLSRRIRGRNVCYDLDAHCRARGARFTHAGVESIDPAGKKVITDEGEFEADFLLICLGCDTNYFGNEDAECFSPGLKTVEEANTLRERTLEKSEAAHVLVVGGGYTGFETASHLAYLLHTDRGIPYSRLWEESRVMILEVADDVLANVGPPARAYAKRIIKDFGVRIRTGVTVGTFRDRDTVTLTDGTTIEDAVVAWTAGVKPAPACRELDTRPELSGRIAVDRYLRVRGANGVFAAGDVAGTRLPGKAGPLRLSVQFSIEGGRLAAQNVVAASGGRPLMPFVPYDPGYVLPLAPGKGSGIILGQQLEGLVPCALHYGMSIARSRGLRNQVGLIRDLARTLRQVPSS